jgi:serine/threonine protein kinase
MEDALHGNVAQPQNRRDFRVFFDDDVVCNCNYSCFLDVSGLRNSDTDRGAKSGRKPVSPLVNCGVPSSGMTAVPDLYASGQKLGRYQLVRRLAVGGMAEIYLARLPGVGIEGFEKLVVIKRILPQHALDPELLRMFLDEARLSATLTHPHVTEVYDVGTDGETPFFAMEYVLGANLRQLMQAHARARLAAGDAAAGGAAGEVAAPLPLSQAIGIVAAAAAGLHYAHEKRGPGGEPLHIVHRDVSPSNVLVSYDGAVKVSDFGIAKWAYQRTRTQEGALKGKFAYMSPEQCRGKPLDARSDVFALGTILYELTTGRSPFAAATDFEILNNIVGEPPTPPTWDGERPYPPALAAIVTRALAREPDERTPTARALQVELEAFARGEQLDVSTVALGELMQTLFADDLASWRAAQREGKSLADHLAEREARRPRADGPRTATDAFAATRRVAPRRSARRTVAVAALLALTATGGLIAASMGKHAPAPAAVPPPPSAAVSPTAATPVGAELATPASTGVAPGNNVETHPVATTHVPLGSDKSVFRRGARVRVPRVLVAPAPGRAPASPESRLHAWDPDSPVPP